MIDSGNSNHFLGTTIKKGVFSDSDYSEIFPTGTTIPTMYGLPKTHKHGVPLRPILSMVGSFNHSFVKWLGRKLEPLRSAKSIARDSFSLGFLRDSNLNSGFFVSYDVVSLFTNIPLNDTIDIILEHLYPRTSGLSARDRMFEGMTKTVFKRSLEWCLKDNVFIFNSKFYLQIDGCAMGSPLVPILADIFMNHILEDNITRNTEHNFKDISFKSLNDFPQFDLKLFIRYVDDTLAVFDSRKDALDFLDYLNSLHHSIEFTIECEENNIISFLDLQLIKNRDSGMLDITVYRKPTHSGAFTNYTSFIPHYFKVGLIKTLVCRAYRICSTWTLFHKEVEFITKTLMNNGYTRNFIQSIIHSSLTRYFTEYNYTKEGPGPLKLCFYLPYIEDASFKIQGSINSCFNQLKLGFLNISVTHSFTRTERFFKHKDLQPKHLLNNVVYQITCSCNYHYIGEMSRCLQIRYNLGHQYNGSR